MSTPYIFLKLTAGGRIEGEATERFFEKQIEISSLKWDMEVSEDDVDGRQQLSRIEVTPRPKRVKLDKSFDRSSINFCDFMAKRKPFDEAVITLVRSLAVDDKPRPWVEVTLTKGYIESVSLTASESGKSVGVKETVELSFNTLKILYYPLAESSLRNDAATTFQVEMPKDGK